jgi:hypothetical protein
MICHRPATASREADMLPYERARGRKRAHPTSPSGPADPVAGTRTGDIIVRIRFATLGFLMLAPLAAGQAQGVLQTHGEQGVSGKVPTKAYRPLGGETCRTARNFHQTGKIPLTPQVAVDREACGVALAQRESRLRRD